MCAAFRLINGKKYKRKGKEVKKNPLDQRGSQSLEQFTDPLQRSKVVGILWCKNTWALFW